MIVCLNDNKLANSNNLIPKSKVCEIINESIIFRSTKDNIKGIFECLNITVDCELSILFYEKTIDDHDRYNINWIEFLSTNEALSVDSKSFQTNFHARLGDLRYYWNAVYCSLTGYYDFPIIDVLEEQLNDNDHLTFIGCPLIRTHIRKIK